MTGTTVTRVGMWKSGDGLIPGFDWNSQIRLPYLPAATVASPLLLPIPAVNTTTIDAARGSRLFVCGRSTCVKEKEKTASHIRAGRHTTLINKTLG